MGLQNYKIMLNYGIKKNDRKSLFFRFREKIK